MDRKDSQIIAAAKTADFGNVRAFNHCSVGAPTVDEILVLLTNVKLVTPARLATLTAEEFSALGFSNTARLPIRD